MGTKKTSWASTSYQGVRFREHENRSHNRKPDRYFSIRYRIIADGRSRQVEEGVGWASEGYTALKASSLRTQILQRIDELGRPFSLSELRGGYAEQHSTDRLIARQRNVTVRQAGEAFLEWTAQNLRSSRPYTSRVRQHIIPYLGEYRMIDVTPTLITAFLAHMQAKKHRGRPLSPGTIKNCMVICSKLFNQSRLIALDEDYPQIPLFSGDNPCKFLRLPKPSNTRWRVLTIDQEKILFETARQNAPDKSSAYPDAILFSLHTGARISEVCGLEWKFVDLERNAIRLHGKGGKCRTVFADAVCMRMLRRRCEHFGNRSHVFWKITKPIGIGRLGQFFRDLMEQLGWNDGFENRQDHLVFHSLRHTYGTRAIMSGMNPITLKTLTGHRSLTTTERYVHLAEEFMRGQVTG